MNNFTGVSIMEKNKKKNNKKAVIGMIIYFGICLCIGILCGIFMSDSIDKIFDNLADPLTITFSIIYIFLAILFTFYIQIIVHEGGHLIFGLLTGYKFSSFRIGNWMIIKQNGKLRFCKYKLAGTGGQCLLKPPVIKDSKIPFKLYNLGGGLMNFLVAGIFVVLLVAFPNNLYLSAFSILMIIYGFVLGASNLIPLSLGGVNNDGKNIISMGKSKESLYSFWLQMKIHEYASDNVRVKDIPEELFKKPDENNLDNPMITAVGVFVCNRLMDMHNFDEAYEYMEYLMNNAEEGLLGVYRNLLTFDCIYCELIGENKADKINSLYTKQIQMFEKQMKNYPSVLRTQYAYALLFEKDVNKANIIKDKFNNITKSYPYLSDIESEREFMSIAECKISE